MVDGFEQVGGLEQPKRPAAGRIKRRRDFVHVAAGRRWHGKALTLQARARLEAGRGEQPDAPRFGFTLTKKVGCAVVRNRARRRLREAVRLDPDLPARSGFDYVLVGRLQALRMSFPDLQNEVRQALAQVHNEGRASGQGVARQREPEQRQGSDRTGASGEAPPLSGQGDRARQRRGGKRIRSKS